MRTLYKNARIYTMNNEKPWAEEILIDGKSIVAIDGSIEDADKIIDCKGNLMLPAFIDSHNHPCMIAKSVWHERLPLFDDVGALLAYVKKFAEDHPIETHPFLYFDYYLTELFDESGPTKELLDKAVSDRPCMLVDFTEHASWHNSKMLELMEIDKDTPDGNALKVFQRDENGEPTGWIKEFAWVDHIGKMYSKIGWQPPTGFDPESQLKVLNTMTEWGYSGVFSGFIEDEEEIKSLYELDKQGLLNFYYDTSYRCDDPEELPGAIEKYRTLKEKYSSEHLKFNTMKLFLDGSMYAGTVGLLEPMCNDPSGTNCGIIALTPEEMESYFKVCNEEGLDVHMHVLGDATFRQVCNVVESLKNTLEDKWKIQIVIAHCCLVDKADRKRPAELGITLNVTPHWNGGMYGESALEVLGQERWVQQSAFREMFESGATVACSTDTTSMFEFNRSNPFWGIQIGATKIDIEYPLDPDKYEESVMPLASERIPIEYLVKGFTLDGAKQMRIDDITGSIEVGKNANFIVLSQNIFDIDANEIKDTEVLLNVFEGKHVVDNL